MNSIFSVVILVLALAQIIGTALLRLAVIALLLLAWNAFFGLWK